MSDLDGSESVSDRTSLPTPRASGAMSVNLNLLKKLPYKGRLEEKVARMLPTPTVCNDSFYYNNSPNKEKRHSKGLATEIIDGEKHNLDSNLIGKNIYLNPQFCEEMMGFPVDWTKIE